MAAIKVKGQICVFVVVFFVILGLENVYLDTKIFFPCDLETEILIHVYSGGHFKKMAAIKVKGQIWNGPIAKIYRHGMFSYHAKFHAFIIK